MPLINWSDEMSVKNALMDMQHKELVKLINRLADAMQKGNATAELGAILNELVGYTIKHFRDEERLFCATAYPASEAHKEKHRNLVKKVEELQRDFNAGRAALSVSVLSFLKDWLMEHIMKTDMTYSKYV